MDRTGLFIRAIGESASVLASWGIDRDGRGKVASTRIAEIAGCPTTPYAALLNCVRTIDAQILTDAYFTYSVSIDRLSFYSNNFFFKCIFFSVFDLKTKRMLID